MFTIFVKLALVPVVDNFTEFVCQLSGNSGSLNVLEPSGPVKALQGLLKIRTEFGYPSDLTFLTFKNRASYI